jgi:hypothetical protein
MIDFKVYNTIFFYLEFLIGISPAGVSPRGAQKKKKKRKSRGAITSSPAVSPVRTRM